MRKKGYQKNPDPEKMPPVTRGICLARDDAPKAGLREQLTGGNQPADEAGVADLVVRFITKR